MPFYQGTESNLWQVSYNYQGLLVRANVSVPQVSDYFFPQKFWCRSHNGHKLVITVSVDALAPQVPQPQHSADNKFENDLFWKIIISVNDFK